jgi:sulfoxide reductase heme-binding subunit YedZ
MKHKHITVGVASFILLIPLAITSSDRMIQRLGVKRWQAMHQLVYLAAAGGVIHYLWLVKKDREKPLIYAVVLVVVLGCRVVAWRYARHRGT